MIALDEIPLIYRYFPYWPREKKPVKYVLQVFYIWKQSSLFFKVTDIISSLILIILNGIQLKNT